MLRLKRCIEIAHEGPYVLTEELRLFPADYEASLSSSQQADHLVRLVFWTHYSGVSVENEFERMELGQV